MHLLDRVTQLIFLPPVHDRQVSCSRQKLLACQTRVIARHSALVARCCACGVVVGNTRVGWSDIEVLVDHPAIDTENGARMDVRISKPGVQNAGELIDVQVTFPFCVEAAGLVGKAATIAESKKRTKYRPAVVTKPSSRHTVVWAPLSERSWPRSPQMISKPGPPGCKKPRGAFHVSSRSTTRASSPSATAPSDPPACPALLAPLRPVPGPVVLACVFSPGELLRLFWPLGVKFLVPSRLFWV